MSLTEPLIFGWVIDEFIKSPSASVPVIGAGLMLIVYAVRLGLSAASSIWVGDTYQRLVMDLRLRLLEHFDRLSLDYHETRSLGAKNFVLIDSVDDIAIVGAEVIPQLTRSVIAGLLVPIMMIIISPRLALVLLCALPLYLLATKYFKRQIRSTTDAANDALDRMSQYVHEHLATVSQIQILTHEAREFARASSLFADVKRYQRERVKSEVRYGIANGAITAVSIVIVFGYGGHLARMGTMSIGSLVVCYSYLLRLFDPISSIAGAHTKIQKCISSIHRLREFLAVSPSVPSPAFPRPVRQPESLLLECDEVSFSYNGERMAVRNLTCRLYPNERIAIVGKSGTGKSTAAKLIARLYDPQVGMVKVNGDDVRLVDLGQLRRLVHYMPQHAVLFTGTVEDNLRYGDPLASRAELRRVIEMAHLEPILERMPRGLAEMLGPSGCQISGGERQRIALGRAMLRRPAVLILDEATAFLDGALEGRIFEGLRSLLPETTLIVISHRLSALLWVDRHLLLDQGELVASGTHSSLYGQNSLYREIYDAVEVRQDPETTAVSDLAKT